MSLHVNWQDMLRSSLDEYLDGAEQMINFRKPDDGCLGYPSAVLLFAFVDAVGSYYRKHPTYTVQVERRQRRITETSDHILILNSEHFGCDLTEAALRELYALVRSPLTHNAVLAEGLYLSIGDERPDLRAIATGFEVYLPGLLRRCRRARDSFLAVAARVVPGCEALRELERRSRVAEVRRSVEGRTGGLMLDLGGGSVWASGVGTDIKQRRWRLPWQR